MNLMKALTNNQIVEVYTKNENGVTKAQLSRDFNVNVKSVTKAIELATERRATLKLNRAERKVEQVEEKVMARPKKKVTLIAKPRFQKTKFKKPVNSAMADAFKKAMK